MRRRLFLTLTVVAAACQPPPERSAEATPAAPPTVRAASATTPPGRGPALDLSEVVAQVRRAVRRDGDWLRARGEFHQLSVDATGRSRLAALDAGGAELRLETTAITRGGRPLAGRAAARAEGSTVVVARGAVEERLENRADGVEQRWRLAARPAGTGDLVVSVRVTGLAFAGATAGGLHFGAPGRGSMVRYGAATLLDAAGTPTPLAVRFTNGVIDVTVPAAALEAAAYPAVIDPVISVERAVDQPPGGGPASGAQVRPSAACLTSGPGTCLVAWQDQVVQSFGGGTQIRAARVSGSTLSDLDPDGLDVDPGSSTSDCGAPIVVQAENGGVKEFAVVYSSFDRLGVSSTRRRLKLARVSAAGVLVGTPIQLSTDANGDVQGYDAASDGTTVAVVWNDPQEVRFTTFAGGGTVVPPTVPVAKATAPADSARWDRPAVTWTGSGWFLAWRGSSGTTAQAIRIAFVTTSGGLDPTATTVPGNYIIGTVQSGTPDFLSQPVLASDGAGTVLVLTAFKNGSEPYPGQVLAMRFSKSSSDATAWSIAVPNVSSDNEATGLSAWWDGARFAVLLQSQWGGGQSAIVKTFPATPFTLITDPAPGPAATTQVFPATGVAVNAVRAVRDGSSAPVLVWEDTSGGPADVRANRITPSDSRPGSLLLTTGATDEGAPAAAYHDGVWLVAWEDRRTVAATGSSDVYAVRLNQADGTALDPAGLDLTSAGGFQGGAVAVGGGGGFLVAWADGRAAGNIDIWATRVTTAGAVNPASTQVTSYAARNELPQSAAFDGTDYHLLYTVEDQAMPPSQVLRDARLQPFDLLTRSDAVVATPSSPGNRLHGQLACRGDGCLAAWSEETGSTILARTIVGGTPAAGTVTLAAGLPPTPNPVVSAAATGAPAFLVAWPEANWTTQATDVNGQMVASDGTAVGTPLQLAAGAAGAAAWTAASFDGTDHVVSWAPDSGGLYTGWVSAAGTVRAAATRVVTPGLSSPRPPSATAGDGVGRTLLAYGAFDPAPGVRAQRIKVRLASYLKLPGDACALAGECASGLCVEGFCCPTSCPSGTCQGGTCGAGPGQAGPRAGPGAALGFSCGSGPAGPEALLLAMALLGLAARRSRSHS